MVDDSKLRVLLADDEEAIVHVYSVGLDYYFAPPEPPPPDEVDSLEDELYGLAEDARPRAELTLCRQGEDAVQLVRDALDAEEPFDVIVLDIRMPPGIDGVEAARQIRELMPDVQILFVSGFSDYGRSDLEKLLPPATHMDYIEKPVRLSELADKIIAAWERT